VASDLFGLPRWDFSERLILVMTTYNVVFDESGKYHDSEIVVFAGFLATSEQWTEFGIKWNTLLRKAGLKWLHMVDAIQMNGDYAKFRDNIPERDALLLSLADLVCEHAREGLINRVSMQEFRALDRSLYQRYKDPFYYAFEGSIEALANSPTLEPGDRFNLICDDSEEYSAECLKAYRKLGKLKPAIAKKFGMICFGDDRTYSPLQAADMFAYCSRRVSTGITDDVCGKVLTRFFEVFSDHSHGPLNASP
jgi:hypothetical protein